MHHRWHLGCFPEKVWIARRFDAPPPEGASVLPALEAAWLVASWFSDDAGNRLMLAEIGEALGHPVSTGAGLDASRLRARLREALAEGSLYAYRTPFTSGGAPILTTPEVPGSGGPEPPAEEDKSWVSIQLMDDGNPPQPVPFKKYRIELPDQSVREGLLDEKGKALLQGIPPGVCKVSFPQFHGDDWQAG
ncbi:hypothetical protein [Sorangium sp. So ce131]|uniref:hypothetical protein n=1 Tax=Sorangium sp. So ce131 TaxID=3133282 RepID=UPI003F644D95